MNEKEKDRILDQLSKYVHHSQVEGLTEYLLALKSDGYVEVWLYEQSNTISAQLTKEGKDFLKNGDYKTQKRKSGNGLL